MIHDTKMTRYGRTSMYVSGLLLSGILCIYCSPKGLADISSGVMTLQEARQELERRMILESLERNSWNVTRTAAELGLERTTLHKKIKALDLDKRRK